MEGGDQGGVEELFHWWSIADYWSECQKKGECFF